MSDNETTEALIYIGATILGRYRHPEDWRPQFAVYPGPKHVHELQVLIVGELDPLQVGHNAAWTSYRALSVWMLSAGLPADKIRIHQLPPDVEYAPRIVVPLDIWDAALPIFQALNNPQQ